MWRVAKCRGLFLSFCGWGLLYQPTGCQAAPSHADSLTFTNALVLSIANRVEVRRHGSEAWDPAYVQPTHQVLNPGDRLRTGANSRALLRLSNLTDFPVGELTQLEVSVEERPRITVRVLRGLIYFFHRDKPDEFQVDTPTVSGVVRGTEFTLQVAEDGESKFQVLDGELALTNALGALTLRRGEEGVAAAGKSPRKTAVITAAAAADAVQWCLYYPGILNPEELHFSTEAHLALKESLAAYRSGDLPGALVRYPDPREPSSDEERIYFAAVLLAVGEAAKAERLLASASLGATDMHLQGLGDGLMKVIDAVKQPGRSTVGDQPFHTNSATAWLAESYWQQSRFYLDPALSAARRATELAPDFAFAWTQVAELEFGFGRTKQALAALETSLHLAPRNAQALALKGFLLAARNRTADATTWFDKAIRADGALGNAWLGRGLCLIRQGQTEAGRADLQTAAALEPNRSVLRSYLGKAWSETGHDRLAAKELALAVSLDPQDPTPWLYSALIKELENQINGAVRDLEESVRLNDSRQVYRSRLLLDEDRAVRGANLAGVYAEAGMSDVSLREAGRAVSGASADYSAHLFLANSYNALRDLNGINLRYETPWLNEYLLANLLAPAAAGVFSPNITQQEYARLFEHDRLGLVSSTEYASQGDWAQNAVHYGILDNFSYTLEEDYRSQNGWRPNQDLEALAATVKLKQQLDPEDSVFLQATYSQTDSGDLTQTLYPTEARTGLRVKETQDPFLLTGWHHQWSPGSHTLALAAYWRDRFTTHDPAQSVLFVRTGTLGVNGVASDDPRAPANYQDDFEGYTAELQQIRESAGNALVAGARLQGGRHETYSKLGESSLTDFVIGTNPPPGLLVTSPATTDLARSTFARVAAYAYDTWRLLDNLRLTGGFSYDWLNYPDNFRDPPLSSGKNTTDQLSPKAGVIWEATSHTVIRGAYTESLGGVSFDQSLRLEPPQVAGFNQAFRSLAPESAAGLFSGARFQTREFSLEQKLWANTYLGAQLDWLSESGSRELGAFATFEYDPPTTTKLHNNVDYDEKSLLLTLNQLVGAYWSFGARYRLSEAELQTTWDIPPIVWAGAQTDVTALMHQLNVFAQFAHRSGFFAIAEAIWNRQTNDGYSPALPTEDFWQFNLFAGYRFPRRRAQIQLGLLNLADRDYHLNPLNLMSDLPQRRALVMNFRFAF